MEAGAEAAVEEGHQPIEFPEQEEPVHEQTKLDEERAKHRAR